MLKKNTNEVFIENTVKIHVQTKSSYSEILIETLNEIKNPYAQSLSCIAFGFIAGENAIPILIKNSAISKLRIRMKITNKVHSRFI